MNPKNYTFSIAIIIKLTIFNVMTLSNLPINAADPQMRSQILTICTNSQPYSGSYETGYPIVLWSGLTVAVSVPNIDIASGVSNVMYKANTPQPGNQTHFKLFMHYTSTPFKSFKVRYLAYSPTINYLQTNYKQLTFTDIAQLTVNTVAGSTTRNVYSNFNLYVTVNASNSLVFIPFITGLKIFTTDGGFNFQINFIKNTNINIFVNATCYQRTIVSEIVVYILIYDVTLAAAYSYTVFADYQPLTATNNVKDVYTLIYYNANSMLIGVNEFRSTSGLGFDLDLSGLSLSILSSAYFTRLKFSVFSSRKRYCPSNTPYFEKTLDLCYEICPAGYLSKSFASGKKICQSCSFYMTRCLECTSQITCTKCEANSTFDATVAICLCSSGFYYNSTTISCVACDQSCLLCSQGTSMSCSQCRPGYYLSSGTCYACSNGCTSCTSATNCVACSNGYRLSGGVCIAQICPQYCKQCDTNPTLHCVQCKTNFTLASDQQSCQCIFPYQIENSLCINKHFGCHIIKPSPDGTPMCVNCDVSKHLQFDGDRCVCKPGYAFNNAQQCRDFCGDGLVFQTQCDDANTVSGDGCSSTCLLEKTNGFMCDTNVQPVLCRSEVILRYKIKQILKDESSNKAIIILQTKNFQFLPFAIQKQHFQPLTSHLKLQIFLDETTNDTHPIVDLTLDQVTPDRQLTLTFPYDFKIEGLRAKIFLNYEQTKYKNQTQNLYFTLTGDNYALDFISNVVVIQSMETGMLVQTILNLLFLCVGLISPKFIGLESILTLQLIFYSQILIFDISMIPPQFIFLKYLRFSSGYNNFLQWTQLKLENNMQKKMNLLQMRKLFLENFNLSFIILSIAFLTLLVTSVLVHRKINQMLESNEERKQSIDQEIMNSKKQKEPQRQVKNQFKILRLFTLLQKLAFFVANQIAYWMILSIVSAFSAKLIIPNDQFYFVEQNSKLLGNVRISQFDPLVIFLSFFIIIFIGLNNFKNLWLGQHTFNKLSERPEEIQYKATLFVYLFLIGFTIFIFNQLDFFHLHASAIVFLIHTSYLIAVAKIDPYRQSLSIHKVGLIISNVLFFVYLAVINLINYVKNLDNLIILLLGYVITFGCGLVIIMTLVRLYYELRYGEKLEKQIQEERAVKAKQEELKRQQQLRVNENRLEEEAKLRQTEAEKERSKNPYLVDNIQRQEEQMEYLEWLEGRNLDQKAKDGEYFKKYTEKPLKWLEVHDKPKYIEKTKKIGDMKDKSESKFKKRSTDPEYQEVLLNLRNQFNALKLKKQSKSLRKRNQR